jgi:hypothetical protein
MTSETTPAPDPPAADRAAEELRLWADYYEAASRAVEMVRAGGMTDATLARILAEDARAARAIKRIKEIRGIKD